MSWPFPMESVHPMVVHLPIALLATGVGLDLVARALHRPALHGIALWNLSLGALGAGLAVATGLQAEDVAKHSFEIYQVMELHQKLGISTLILSVMLVAWRLAHRDRLTPRARAATLLGDFFLIGLLAYTAHLGGRLVYEFGVGGTFGQPARWVPPS